MRCIVNGAARWTGWGNLRMSPAKSPGLGSCWCVYFVLLGACSLCWFACSRDMYTSTRVLWHLWLHGLNGSGLVVCSEETTRSRGCTFCKDASKVLWISWPYKMCDCRSGCCCYLRIQGYLFGSGITMSTGICFGDVPFITLR